MKKLTCLMVQVIFLSVLTIFAQNTQKALTNSDVRDMVKAGLSESTIILSIERSPANYDTSTQALIQMNKEGISSKILDAMVKAGTPSPVQNSPVTNETTKGSFQEMSSTTAVSGGVVLVDGSKRSSMKRMLPSTKTDSGKMLIPYAGIFMKAKSYLVFNGNHSDLRTGNKSPSFEVDIASDIKASDALGLLQLETEKETRKSKMLEVGAFGGKSGTSSKFIIPIEIKEISTRAGMTTYRISPITPMKAGEYAVVVNSGFYYDFGVDTLN